MLQQRLTNRFIRHLLFWAGVILFFFIGYFSQPEVYTLDPIPFLVELFFASLFTFLFYTYLLNFSLLPLLFRGSYGWFTIGLLGLYALASILSDTLVYVQELLLHWVGHDHRFSHAILFTNPFSALKSVFFFEINLVAGLMAGVKLFYQWRQKQQESQRLQRQKLQTELQLLKLQLNPNFLFGSLGALHTLTQQQSTMAPRVVLKLAHCLRYVLYESQVDRVPLNQELDVIHAYVFLQRTIRPKHVEVSFSVRGNIDNQQIAPLSLFSIVETIFSQLPTELIEPTWVSIDLAVTETQLTLKVIHELMAQPDDKNNSLTNVDGLQKQLAFYYRDNHSLNVLQEDQIHVVTLTISFPTNRLETMPLST